MVLNAIVHRDYTCAADTVVKVFNDRIEIFNPGKLPDGLTVEHLIRGDYVSSPRNRKIAELFKEAGLIEKYGSGISRIRSAYSGLDAPAPHFEEIAGGFRVILYSVSAQSGNASSTTYVGGISQLEHFVAQNPGLRSTHIATALGIPQKTVEKQIAKLTKSGKIEFRGSKKTG